MEANETKWKIAVIGGGGKIAGATMLELLDRGNLGNGEIVLYGRSRQKIDVNLGLADKVCPSGERRIRVRAEDTLEEALRDANIVLFGATSGLQPFGGFRAMGVMNAPLIMHVAEKMRALCPDGWLLVSTNPPDIPLAAAYERFGSERVIGLCNASVFARKVLAGYLNCAETELSLYEVGLNHEVWFYEILRNGTSVYDELRRTLPDQYTPDAADSPFLRRYPEWALGFVNTIAIMQATGYLSAPVGGSRRFTGLPIGSGEIGKLMRRPKDHDYSECLQTAGSKTDVFDVTRRCAAEFPLYIADIVQSILLDDGREHSVQVPNKGTLPAYPDHVHLHMTCRLGRHGLTRPAIKELPPYLETVLATRIRQNALLSSALAKQDDSLLRQSMMAIPERAGLDAVNRAIREELSAEPIMPLN